MTVLQDRLAEVGDEGRRVDPTRLASHAMQGADRRRRTTRLAAGGGTVAVVGLMVVVAQLAGTDALVVAGRPASGGGTFYSPTLHSTLGFVLAVVFSVAAERLVGWRDRSAGVPGAPLERTLGSLWAASLALWAVGAVQLVHAVMIGLRIHGHQYVALLSAGVVPLLAVGLLVNGSPAARRLTTLALAAQSAVVLSVFYAGPGIQVFGGTSALGIWLALVQALVALRAAGILAWRSRVPGAGSPSWPLAAVWSAGALLLVTLFFKDLAVGVDPGVIYNVDAHGYFGLGAGPLAHGIAWGAGSLAALLIATVLWRSRESWAGLAVVLGLMIAVLAVLSRSLSSNAYPAINYGWGPYLGVWWLFGLPVLAWLGVQLSRGRRSLTQEE